MPIGLCAGLRRGLSFGLLFGVGAGDASAAPDIEGRDLFHLDGTSSGGSGPGAALFVETRPAPTFVVGATARAGWTLHPVRLGIQLPIEYDGSFALPSPRLDLRVLIADRRHAPVGLAVDLDLPPPFFPAEDPEWRARTSIALGRDRALIAANIRVAGSPRVGVERLTWSLGGAALVAGPLSAFAELDVSSPMNLATGRFGAPHLLDLRAGIHLVPIQPLILAVAVSGRPGFSGQPGAGPAFVTGASWTPTGRRPRPRTHGLDHDQDGVPNPVDACPRQKEDLDDGNNADGCPDGGAERIVAPTDSRLDTPEPAR